MQPVVAICYTRACLEKHFYKIPVTIFTESIFQTRAEDNRRDGMVQRMIKKGLKVLGMVVAILVGIVATYVIYLFATYHRIEDNLPLTVE